jgi:hypothetical protein
MKRRKIQMTKTVSGLSSRSSVLFFPFGHSIFVFLPASGGKISDFDIRISDFRARAAILRTAPR